MKLRVARHTTDLSAIEDFYCGLLKLERLGGFENHDGYEGVFIGIPGKDWHLEFTVSENVPTHKSDKDDLLVFYVDSAEEMSIIAKRFVENDIKAEIPDNPYWEMHGITYMDPDGFRVVITTKHE